MRKLALDYGSSSLGVAISDPLKTIAYGIDNFRNLNPPFENHLLALEKILKQYQDIEEIILGLPLYLDGNESEISKQVRIFAKKIKERFSKKIVFFDESFTTQRANEILVSANMSRKKRKNHKDKMAAQIILQQYLNQIF